MLLHVTGWIRFCLFVFCPIENCCSLPERHGQTAENVSDWRGRLQEGEHGPSVYRRLSRRQWSSSDTLRHHQNRSVSLLPMVDCDKSPRIGQRCEGGDLKVNVVLFSACWQRKRENRLLSLEFVDWNPTPARPDGKSELFLCFYFILLFFFQV